MVFNSLVFIVFAAVFFGFWPLARKRRNLRWVYIVAFSFLFYGWWDWRYIFLLIATGLIDFYAGVGLEHFSRYRKLILILSLGSNLSVLAFFKYYNFFAANLNAGSSLIGSSRHLPALSLILPIGISFYTFQSMSYTIDIYRRQIRPTHNIFHFFAAIALFPHLVAGPIMRAGKLLPQLLENRAVKESVRWDGLKLIVYGYFKKMVIADNLAPAVNDAFNGQLPFHSTLSWWIIITMFAFQIYNDFSGYTDIARGLAKWMGYEFTVNFDHPYIATSLSEFWSRWHITLTSWFRDYVFFPIARRGAGRPPKWRMYYALTVVMLLSGLWHGAAWTFVTWGACHALYLSLEHLTKWPDRIKRLPSGKLVAWILVLGQVWIAWVFFRANSLNQAMDILRALFSFRDATIAVSGTALLFLALGASREIYCWVEANWTSLRKRNSGVRWFGIPGEALGIALLVVSCVYLRGPAGTFIYFQF